VLIFSWGAILLISRARPRNWWFLLPSVAMLSYGVIFHAGFFNFYLGLGISFWYLAFFLFAGWKSRFAAIPLLLLAWTAHPLPVVWALSLALYTVVAERLPQHARVATLAAGIIALVEVHFFVASHYQYLWSIVQARLVTGADQLLLFDQKYWIPYALLLMAWAVIFWRFLKSHRWQNVLQDLVFQRW